MGLITEQMFDKIRLDYLSRTYSNMCLYYNFIVFFEK
nr:MAG TPA: E2-like protein [Caudoviricetes sp.]